MVIISLTYPDLTCKFPDENDPNKVFSDVTIDAKPYVEKYYQFFDSGDFINATKILNDNPSLKNMIINAAAIQNLYDMCIASQRFYLSDVQQYLVNIVKYKDEWSNTTRYTKYDVVTYIQNGGRESFIGIVKDIPIGTVPTNMDYYVPLTMRGEKGVSGSGLSPRGLWNIEFNYYSDDLVVYKNRWYYAKQDNSQSIPKLVSDDWEMILEVTPQIKTSDSQPTDQSFGDVWLQKLIGSTAGEYNIAMNQIDVEGNYVYLYPKTKAGLVSLSNGKNLQEFYDSLGKSNGIATTDANNKVIQTALNSDFATTSTYITSKTLLANTDLNDIKQPGFYCCRDNDVAATMKNKPSTLAFSLIVTEHAGVCQIYIEFIPDTNKIFTRNYYAFEKRWGSWNRIYTTIDPQVNISGNANRSDVAARIGDNGNTALPMAFNWAGQSGQPPWVWGGGSREEQLVYNPSNFRVKYAESAGTAAPTAHNQSANTITTGTFPNIVAGPRTDTGNGIFRNISLISESITPTGGLGSGEIMVVYSNQSGW